MSSSPTPLSRLAVIDDRYGVRQKLGSGSLGTVYLAHDAVQDRLVALKLLRSEQLATGALERMQEEFRSIALLHHPQIAEAYDFAYTESGGVPYYTREYIAGEPLPPGPPGSGTAAKFLEPLVHLLDALQYVHEQGVLHLDIHAGNLIVAANPRRGAVLIDFGLARSLERPLVSFSGGSWSILPPEMLERKPLKPQTDVYLAGRLLHYRLTGHTEGCPSLPREIPGWGTRLTLELERILSKALEPVPARRFRSAVELRAALQQALGQERSGGERSEPRNLIVGREKELARIDAALVDAAAGKRSSLWISGPDGAGKSRLLAEARLRAQLRGLGVVEARFAPGARAGIGLAQAVQASGPAREGGASWLSPLAPEFGGAPRERSARAAAAYFAGKGRALAILIDDVEHADGETALLVEALAEECRRRGDRTSAGRGLALIVASSRPDRRAEGKSPFETWQECSLKPFRAGASRELLVELLRPLEPSANLLKRAVVLGRGIPLRLRQAAAAIRQTAQARRFLPGAEELASLLPSSAPANRQDGEESARSDRKTLEVLAVLGRAARLEELEAVLRAPRDLLSSSLRRLHALELVEWQGKGAGRRYEPMRDEARSASLAAVPEKTRHAIHLRAARFLELEAAAGKTGRLEDLARHYLKAGRIRDGSRTALRAARELRTNGRYSLAVRILEEACIASVAVKEKLALAEEICSILEETGDHEKAISILEPILRDQGPVLPPQHRVRALRRLGIGYHRAGLPLKAIEVFDDAQRIADPGRDLAELVFIDSEIAELRIFQGSLDAAEVACRRGLERIRSGELREPFRGRLEVTLRASLGHIALRRLDFARGREELASALRLSKGHASHGDRAAILHNLGVAENQLNELSRARKYFEEAERLLLRAGERRNVIKVSTNLALIAAKRGLREEARYHVHRAEEMLGQYPGERLECFAAYSRGLVAHHFGETEAACDALEAAAGHAARLGDVSIEAFALVYLAEAEILAGRHGKAQQRLSAARKRIRQKEDSVLWRMAACRQLLLDALLGRGARAARALPLLAGEARADLVYLEAWNDVFLGLGALACDGSPAPLFERAALVFSRLGIPSGETLARLGLLAVAVARKQVAEIRQRLAEIGPILEAHSFLRIAQPLAVAEACIVLGELDEADRRLAEATSKIVGSPFLELDWRLELLRMNLATRRGDPQEARRHLHRCVHSRDLLASKVPGEGRRRFLRHPRFASLNELASRLKASPRLEHSTRRFRRMLSYEGMVGQSAPMAALFQSIERLRDQEIHVLITGETGTGKELAARAVIAKSLRHERPPVVVHCACLPAELFESELFGYAAGSFTGAEKDHPGMLETASGGTLLLDDIGQLPLESQAKLLRVFESREVRRLGSASSRPIDVRFVATSSLDLRAEARAGKFRQDLFYRVAGVELAVPPLRQRREDIGLLVQHFLERHAARLERAASALEPDALALLEAHDWPGNVRELEALLLRALVVLARPERIARKDLEPLIAPEAGVAASSVEPWPLPGRILDRPLQAWRRELEREYVTRLFLRVKGDTRKMMQELGVKSSKLYEWLHELGLDVRLLRKKL